jgi:hypothetical protein
MLLFSEDGEYSAHNSQPLTVNEEVDSMNIEELRRQLAGTTGRLCGLAKEVVEEADSYQQLALGPLPAALGSQLSALVCSVLSWYGDGEVARPGTTKWNAGVPIYKELEALSSQLLVLGSAPIPETVVVNVEDLGGSSGSSGSNRDSSNAPARGKEDRRVDNLKDRIAKLNGTELLAEISSLRGKLRDQIVTVVDQTGVKRHRIRNEEVDRLCRNFLYYWESGSNNKRVYSRLFGEADRLRAVVKPARSLSSILGTTFKPVGNKASGMLGSAISTLHDNAMSLTEKTITQAGTDGARIIEAIANGHHEYQRTHMAGVVGRAKDVKFAKLEAKYVEIKLQRELAKAAARAAAEDILSE